MVDTSNSTNDTTTYHFLDEIIYYPLYKKGNYYIATIDMKKHEELKIRNQIRKLLEK